VGKQNNANARRAPRRWSWNDPATRALAYQALALALAGSAIWFLVHNTLQNLALRNIATGFGIDTLAIDAEPGLHYMVSLQVQVDNVAVLEANDQRFAPYLLDLEAAGVVTVPPGAEKLAPPEDLAAVNGAALLWSAIREQVLALTSRMPAGPAMLPTVHFHDLKRQPQAAPTPAASEAAAAPAVAVATARKRVRGVRAATKPA